MQFQFTMSVQQMKREHRATAKKLELVQQQCRMKEDTEREMQREMDLLMEEANGRG